MDASLVNNMWQLFVHWGWNYVSWERLDTTRRQLLKAHRWG